MLKNLDLKYLYPVDALPSHHEIDQVSLAISKDLESELAFLAYRRSVVSAWSESTVKAVTLASIDSRFKTLTGGASLKRPLEASNGVGKIRLRYLTRRPKVFQERTKSSKMA
jgi:hypothetical protein